MSKQKKTFQIHAKKLFLTYSQTNITPKDALKKFQIIFQKAHINNFFIVQEKHEDTHNHLHCFLKLNKKAHIKDPNLLDLKTEENPLVHGNYQSCKDMDATLKYMSKDIKIEKKDEQWVADDDLSKRIEITGKFQGLEETMIAMAKKGQIEEAMKLYEKSAPKRFIRDHAHMQKSLKSLYLQNEGLKPVDFKIKDFRIPQKLEKLFETWKNTNFKQTMFLIGKPGSGKTEYVKAWLNENKLKTLVISTKDGLRFLEESHDAILYDDFDFSNKDRNELIFLLDGSERTIDIKHGSKLIKNNLAKVATGNINYSNVPYHPIKEDGAVKRRLLLYDLENESLIEDTWWDPSKGFFTLAKG